MILEQMPNNNRKTSSFPYWKIIPQVKKNQFKLYISCLFQTKRGTYCITSPMFKCKNICKSINSLNSKIVCFFYLLYNNKVYLFASTKSQEESRDFRFQVACVQVPLQKYPPNEYQPNPFLFFNLVCLLSHLLQKIKATMGTPTT